MFSRVRGVRIAGEIPRNLRKVQLGNDPNYMDELKARYHQLFNYSPKKIGVLECQSLILLYRILPDQFSVWDQKYIDIAKGMIKGDLIQLPNPKVEQLPQLKQLLNEDVDDFNGIDQKLKKLKNKNKNIEWKKKSALENWYKPGLSMRNRKNNLTAVKNVLANRTDTIFDEKLFNKYFKLILGYCPHTQQTEKMETTDIEHFHAFSKIENNVMHAMKQMNTLPVNEKSVIFEALKKRYPDFYRLKGNRMAPTNWLKVSLYNYIENLSLMNHAMNQSKGAKPVEEWLNGSYEDVLREVAINPDAKWTDILDTTCYITSLSQSGVKDGYKGKGIGLVITKVRNNKYRLNIDRARLDEDTLNRFKNERLTQHVESLGLRADVKQCILSDCQLPQNAGAASRNSFRRRIIQCMGNNYSNHVDKIMDDSPVQKNKKRII